MDMYGLFWEVFGEKNEKGPWDPFQNLRHIFKASNFERVPGTLFKI